METLNELQFVIFVLNFPLWMMIEEDTVYVFAN